MNEKDREFLVKLQKELNSQEKDSQAHPRFWVIMDYKWVTAAEGCGERTSVYCFDLYESSTIDVEDLGEELADHIDENELEDETNYFNNGATLACLRNETDRDELENILLDLGYEYSFSEEVYEGYIVPNTMFLTKKEAKQYIENNRHHHSINAHTYAMTAWRAPKVERLLDILYTSDFEEDNEKLLEENSKVINRLRKKNMSLGAQLTNLKKELEHSEKLIQDQQQKLRTIVKDKQQIIDELTEKEEKRATVMQRASNRLEFALMSLQEELEGEST